jgi:hypothetical protein
MIVVAACLVPVVVEQQRARTDAQREHDQAAEPERESDRRRSGEQVIRPSGEHVPPERVVDRQYVTVEMHGHLGLAGGTGGRGKQRDVIGCGRDRREPAMLGLAAARQVILGAAVARDRQAGSGGGKLTGASVIAHRQSGAGELGEHGDLPGPQQGHDGHGNPAGLEHAEPRGDQPWVVRAAQQHPVAWHETEVLGEHPGRLLGAAQQLAVCPGFAASSQAWAVRAIAGYGGIKQGLGAIEALWVAQPGEVEAKFRPLIGGRQVVPAEGIGMGGG